MEELKNEGISNENADILYGNKNFTLAIETLIGKDFMTAQSLLEKVLDELAMEGNDFPDILATILKRLAVCQLRQNKTVEFEQTLRELFLTRLSDPNINVYQLFVSAYNLAVFYCKNDSKLCVQFLESLPGMTKDVVILPDPLEAELNLIIGNAYLQLKDYPKAIEIYSKIADRKLSGNKVRGYSLNNRAIATWLQAGWQKDSPELDEAPSDLEEIRKKIETMKTTFDKIENDLRNSIAVLENLDSDADEEMLKKASEAKDAFTGVQLENMIEFVDAQIWKSNSRNKDNFLKKKLSDFAMRSIHSIVPLMNLSEINLLKDGEEVDIY